MKTAFEICVFLLLVGVPLQLYYWFVIRYAGLLKIRFELEKLRHKLQVIETNRDGQAAIAILVKKCNRTLYWMYDFDFVLAIISKSPKEIELQVQRDSEIIADSSVEIREINREIDRLAATAAVLNSPGVVVLCLILTPILLMVALICLAIGKLKNILTNLDRKLWVNVYDLKPC
ncbi:MAG TPA: hypothetical protein VGO57_14310 [Verrucomicrobiae bacterium]|jgi:hypothetical protein